MKTIPQDAKLYTHPAPQQTEKQCQHGAWIDCGICDKPHARPSPQADRQRVPDGWQLVPVDPTWDMQMAASSNYREPRDGHYTARMDCAAEAYRAMLAAAPEAPAQASAVDERAIDAAARKIAECMDYPWEHMPEKGRSTMRDHAKAVLDAARAAAEAPAQASAVDERDRKDAERYRFIRNADRSDPHLPYQALMAYACESFDEAIDDAMEEEARAALAQKGGK